MPPHIRFFDSYSTITIDKYHGTELSVFLVFIYDLCFATPMTSFILLMYFSFVFLSILTIVFYFVVIMLFRFFVD